MLNFKLWLEQTGWELFHGSNNEQLAGSLRVNERDSGWFGAGFYLTAYPEYAKRWGNFVYKMYAPKGKYAEATFDDNYQKVHFLGDAEAANNEAGGTAAWIENESAWSAAFTNALKKMGYVGVRVHQSQHKDVEVLVFDPSHIQVGDKIN